jgi:hypothetical protein
VVECVEFGIKEGGVRVRTKGREGKGGEITRSGGRGNNGEFINEGKGKSTTIVEGKDEVGAGRCEIVDKIALMSVGIRGEEFSRYFAKHR